MWVGVAVGSVRRGPSLIESEGLVQTLLLYLLLYCAKLHLLAPVTHTLLTMKQEYNYPRLHDYS